MVFSLFNLITFFLELVFLLFNKHNKKYCTIHMVLLFLRNKIGFIELNVMIYIKNPVNFITGFFLYASESAN